MPSTINEIERDIQIAVTAGFRERLLARGQARSMIWRDGKLPEDTPPFSELLSYDLLSYGYSLLSMGIRLLESEGNQDIARLAFEHAASAIEAVIAKGDATDHTRAFHNVVAASAYHLGRFSARAYSLLTRMLGDANISPVEKCLSLLMLRNLDELSNLVASWRLDGMGTDKNLVTFLKEQDKESTDAIDDGDIDESSAVLDAIDLALTDNFMSAVAVFLLALERGDSTLVDKATIILSTGLAGCADLNLVPQWWNHRLAIHLIKDLWSASFHVRLPLLPNLSDSAEWKKLRQIFIALLYRRSKAEIELWPSQLDATARAVSLNEDLVVSLPTSSGKTRIAEICILRCLSAGKRVLFITPLRALSAQTEVSLQRTFLPLGKSISTLYGSIGASNFEEDVLRKRDIIVATPEKLDFALRNDPSLINDVGLIVLDEGHMIGINEREVRYEAQIQRLLKREDAEQRRIVCLSAILPGGDQLNDFVNWLTRDRAGGLVQNDWRPTRLRYGEIIWNGNSARMNIQVGDERPFVNKFLVAKTPPKGRRKIPFPSNQRELCLATAWRLVEDGQTVLVYCPERRSVNPFAEAIVDLNERGLLPSVLEKDVRELNSALTIGSEWLGRDHPILQCLKLGVAIHHGTLPTPFRKEVERLLREDVLKITISSPTLAQGINLSATALVVHSLWRNRKLIEGSEFRNVVGRAGRAFVDVEGLVLHPMFDEPAKQRKNWQKLIKNDGGRQMESGLLLLILELLDRMQRKLGNEPLETLLDYVMNNAKAWDFPDLKDEAQGESAFQRTRWEGFLASLDTAILSLIGEQNVADTEIESKLDDILALSLMARRLVHRSESERSSVRIALLSRAKYIWSKSTPTQRRGYFLAGVGLNTGHQLDAISAEATPLLVQANNAILLGDEKTAITTITGLAEKIFNILPFTPDPLPENWRLILDAWLRGKPILEIATGNEDEALEFVESGLIYRLPWGMEAIRVRGIANGDSIGDGLTLEDTELRLATAAVETGTLNRSAALLMQAGFTSRLSAIKAINDTKADFTMTSELIRWLNSPVVAQFENQTDWPSAATAKLWHQFKDSFSASANKVWSLHTLIVPITWANGLDVLPIEGTPVRVLSSADTNDTMVLTPDYELLGSLSKPLNPARAGLVLATVNANQTSLQLDYLGPDDFFAT